MYSCYTVKLQQTLHWDRIDCREVMMNTATREINKNQISWKWLFFSRTTALLFITVQLVCMYCYFHACEFCGILEPPAACLTPLKCEQPLLKDEAWISSMERATDRWIMIAVGLLYHTLLLQKNKLWGLQQEKERKSRKTHKSAPRGEPVFYFTYLKKRLNRIKSQFLFYSYYFNKSTRIWHPAQW